MPAGVYQRKEFSEYFWNKVDKKGLGECWLWKGSCYKNGYGTIRRDGKVASAHRTSYDLHHPLTSPISDIKLDVCHKCDNVKCINPNHLFLGTRSDNMRDCVEKERNNHVGLCGSANGFSKYTEDDIKQLRADFATGDYTKTDLAIIYDMPRTTVSDIINRKRWNHI
jgi:hypothetical protein